MCFITQDLRLVRNLNNFYFAFANFSAYAFLYLIPHLPWFRPFVLFGLKNTHKDYSKMWCCCCRFLFWLARTLAVLGFWTSNPLEQSRNAIQWKLMLKVLRSFSFWYGIFKKKKKTLAHSSRSPYPFHLIASYICTHLSSNAMLRQRKWCFFYIYPPNIMHVNMKSYFATAHTL